MLVIWYSSGMSKKKKELTIKEVAAMGGKARAEKLSPERRKEIAIHAVQTREAKKKKKEKES